MARPKTQSQFGDVLFEPVSEGVIMEGVLSHYVSPKGAVSYAENMHNDTIGMMTTRRPFVSRFTPTANPISCVLFQSRAGSPFYVWNQGGDFLFTGLLSGGAVTTHAGILSTTRTRFETALGYLCMTAGSGQPRYFDDAGVPVAFGTSFPALSDLISIYSGYLWMASSVEANNRVYYSDVLPSTFPTSVTGGGSTSYLTINARLGDKITGFASTQNLLYVFTTNNIFRISSTTSVDNSPMASVGAVNQESIVQAKNGFYFFHNSGVFFLQQGGQPQEISVKIRDILNKIPNVNYSKILGWSDDDHVYFSLGKGLSGLQANKSYIIRYTISTQVWTIYSTLSFLPNCASSANFTNSSVTDAFTEDIFPTNLIMGQSLTDLGGLGGNFFAGTFNVFNQNTENSTIVQDWNSFPIPVEYQTNWITYDSEHYLTRIDGIFFPSLRAAGMKVSYQTDNDLPNVWKEIGVLGSEYMTEFKSWQSNPFNRIKFRFYGVSNGTTMQIGVPVAYIVDNLGFKSS